MRARVPLNAPRYPEKWAALAYRIAMNYFIYDLTH